MKNIYILYFIVIILFVGAILSSCNTVRNSADIKWEKDIKHTHFISKNHFNYVVKKYDDYIFYVSSEGIIKRNEITGESACIVYDDCIEFMLVKDNTIYYSECVFVDDRIVKREGKIYSVDLNGDNKQLVCDVSEFVSNDNLITREFSTIDSFYIYGDDIFIQSSMELYKYNMNTKESSIIIDDISYGVFLGEKIYYIDHAFNSCSVYEKDLYSNEVKLIAGDGQGKRGNDRSNIVVENIIKNFFIFDGKLYYIKTVPYLQIYQYNVNEEDILIEDFAYDDDNVFAIYVGDDKVYYRIGNDFYEHNPENEEIKKLTTVRKITSDTRNSQFMVVNDTLIYYEDENSGNICYLKLDEE